MHLPLKYTSYLNTCMLVSAVHVYREYITVKEMFKTTESLLSEYPGLR